MLPQSDSFLAKLRNTTLYPSAINMGPVWYPNCRQCSAKTLNEAPCEVANMSLEISTLIFRFVIRTSDLLESETVDPTILCGTLARSYSIVPFVTIGTLSTNVTASNLWFDPKNNCNFQIGPYTNITCNQVLQTYGPVWSTAPLHVVSLWKSSNCNAGICRLWQSLYNVIPFFNLGTLPPDLQLAWNSTQMNCNSVVVTDLCWRWATNFAIKPYISNGNNSEIYSMWSSSSYKCQEIIAKISCVADRGAFFGNILAYGVNIAPRFSFVSYSIRSNNMTVEMCVQRCDDAGHPYAAIKMEDCYCGSPAEMSLSFSLPQYPCDTLCTGNPDQLCGGINAYSIYGTSLQPAQDACLYIQRKFFVPNGYARGLLLGTNATANSLYDSLSCMFRNGEYTSYNGNVCGRIPGPHMNATGNYKWLPGAPQYVKPQFFASLDGQSNCVEMFCSIIIKQQMDKGVYLPYITYGVLDLNFQRIFNSSTFDCFTIRNICVEDVSINMVSQIFPYMAAFNSPILTNRICVEMCLKAGYAFAATGQGRHCFCGMQPSLDAAPIAHFRDCNIPCSGDRNSICGGVNRLLLFRTMLGSTQQVCATMVRRDRGIIPFVSNG
jgi:hypothetical protein